MTISPSRMITICALCAALAIARPSSAAPPPTVELGPRTVKLRVDVHELGDKAIGLEAVLIKQLGPRIAEAGFELVDEGAATVLLLRLRPLQSSPYDYGLHFEFIEDGHRTPAVEWVDCHVCADQTLIPAIDERLPALILALDARAEELAAESAGDGDGGEPVEATMPRRMTGLGIAGSTVAGVGAGVLIGGAVELSRGLVVDDRLNVQDKRIDHRPPGHVLIAVGATALAMGVVLLGVDLAAQSRKRKDHAQAKRAQLFPILTPESVGLGIVGRF